MDYLGKARHWLKNKDYYKTLGLTYDMSIEELEWWIELAEKLKELLDDYEVRLELDTED